MIEYAADSTEFVAVRVIGKQQGTLVDPTGDAAYIAVIESGDPDSGDWQAASWETDSTHSPPKYFARTQLSAFGVVADTFYSVWVKVVDSPETIIKKVAPIHVY